MQQDLPSPQDVPALARRLALPQTVCARLEAAATPALLARHREAVAALTDPARAPEAAARLARDLAGDDPGGMRLLALYLAAACRTWELYRAAGVPEAVFWDTMGCFARFLRETQLYAGDFAFDRSAWAWRQLACRLFRLGTLEFEYRLLTEAEPQPPGLAPGQPVLSVHIPSDARLTQTALSDSYGQARRFFAAEGAAFCENGPPRVTLCGTWLLAPALRGLLAPCAGILRFAEDYELYAEFPEEPSFYRWLFAGKQPPEPLPQTTSLQRAAAAHLAAGGKIGEAWGVKRET